MLGGWRGPLCPSHYDGDTHGTSGEHWHKHEDFSSSVAVWEMEGGARSSQDWEHISVHF